jgi:pyrroline-5-carboxylate reductase
MSDWQLAFIGAGNMASAIIGGLVKQGFDPARIIASDPNAESLARLARATGVTTAIDNAVALEEADVVVLAVKPQVMKQVLTNASELMNKKKPLLISIAAGIRSNSLTRWAGALPVVRCMPNTPALVGLGMTVLSANASVTPEQRQRAESILAAVGQTRWTDDETLLDAVTAVSGSGPAYFFLVMEAMQAAAESLGLSPEAARQLVVQTARGAAELAAHSDESTAQLRINVTSPGGTTERALAVLESAGLREHFQAALTAACDRSRELADQLGQ